jgi:dephospho-CoA kinase
MSAPVHGLTGGIACGKSTVSRLLAERGAVVIDADALAREVVALGTPGLAEVVAAFGADVLRADGTLDRERLGARVFAEPEARARLNAITHPRIAQTSFERIAAARESGAPLVVYDAALLFESGRGDLFRPVVVVTAPREVQLARLMRRDGLSAEAAAARIDSQMPVAEKAARADHVIDNGGALAQTEAQVEALWQQWMDPCKAAPSTR